MFIIERRTAGVFAALAIAAAMVVLGNLRDPVEVVETRTTASSTTALATPVGLGVRPNVFAANEAQAARGTPDAPQSK